jgi:DNA (cytosine-5)-methyltransferase 1
MPFRVIDLFSGCGGLSTGFLEEGFEIIASVEINAVAVKTYARNFPRTHIFNQDIRDIDPSDLRRNLGLERGELDCLIGGPPCQGFSKNVPAMKRFLDDPRNKLMQVFLAFVKEFRPKAVLIENVAEIVKAFDGTVSNEVLSELNADYSAKVRVLNARDYGIPQIRRRAFFLASRVKGIEFPEPTHSAMTEEQKPSLYGNHQATLFDEYQLRMLTHRQEPYVSVWDAIGELPSLDNGEGENPCEYTSEPQTPYQRLLRENATVLHDHVARRLTPIQYQRISLLGEGQSMPNLPEELRAKKGYSGAYGRLISNEPARTITKWVFHPGSGRFGHPYDNRVITIREAARLQSFPDWFVFEGTYLQKSSQVGEAVPPLLVRKLADSLAKNLGG